MPPHSAGLSRLVAWVSAWPLPTALPVFIPSSGGNRPLYPGISSDAVDAASAAKPALPVSREPSWPGASAGGWGKTRRRCHWPGNLWPSRVNEALAPLVATCWLITNQPLAHLAFGLPLLTDLQPFQGPAGGLLTALFWARTPWVLAAAVDNPFLAPALLAELAARARRTSRPAVVCRSPGAWSLFPGSTPSACCPPCGIFSRPTAAPPVSWRFAGPRFYLSRKYSPWTPKAGAFLTSILPGT